MAACKAEALALREFESLRSHQVPDVSAFNNEMTGGPARMGYHLTRNQALARAQDFHATICLLGFFDNLV